MPIHPPSRPCPHCKSSEFADLSSASVEFNREGAWTALNTHFTVRLCTGCGAAEWFAENVKEVLKYFGDHAKIVRAS
jgi:hypothetical protein